MTLGMRITELRLGREESLQDVAHAVGVSKAHIWDLEKGRSGNPSIQLLQRLADHFRVSVGYLIDEEPDASAGNLALARMVRLAKTLDPHDLELLDRIMHVVIEWRREGATRAG